MFVMSLSIGPEKIVFNDIAFSCLFLQLKSFYFHSG